MKVLTRSMKKWMVLILFTVVLWWIFDNIKLVGNGIGLFLGIVSPFIIGIVIAFILNKPMSFIEEKLFHKGKVFGGLKDKYARVISFLITLILFILIIALVLILVVPNLIDAGEQVADKLPGYWEKAQDYLQASSIKYSKINDWIQSIDVENFKDSIIKFVRGGFSDWLGSTFTIFSSVLGGFVSVLLGFVFAVYFLLRKEELLLSFRKFIYAVLPLNIARKTFYVSSVFNKSFSRFLTGQTLDSLAVGILFLISMKILGFPYAIMVGVLITICSFVPIVGSFIGLFIGTFLIFVESPKMAGFFIILFFVIQQVEGNLIYPKVVGKASGLSPVWTLAAVTLGGSIMGILGIILFVPIFAGIQTLLSEYIDKQLGKKEIGTLE